MITHEHPVSCPGYPAPCFVDLGPVSAPPFIPLVGLLARQGMEGAQAARVVCPSGDLSSGLSTLRVAGSIGSIVVSLGTTL